MNEIMPKVAGALKPEIAVYEFSKENKTQAIPFDALSRSIRRDPGLVGIRAVPQQFWTMYAILTSLLTENNVNFTEGDFHVQWNSSKAYLTDTEKADGYDAKRAPVDRWRHDKVITLIQMPGIVAGTNNEIRNSAIGLTLNKEGLAIAFGMNVHECTNFNVLGGTVLRSYDYGSDQGLQWELIMHKLRSWIGNLNQIWKVQNEIMETMKEYQIHQDIPIIEEIIGDLYIKAIKQAYYKGAVTPFDTHELSNFTKEMIQARKTEDRIANVWDLYNWGTSIMKPGIVDIGEIANNSNLWASYLMEKFEIDQQEVILID